MTKGLAGKKIWSNFTFEQNPLTKIPATKTSTFLTGICKNDELKADAWKAIAF
jgi:hypothetical protein